ncbi:MAG: hypothetical protein ACWA5Q_07175 [bacterium]
MDSAGQVIPAMLLIDVEPNEFHVDLRKPNSWTGFEYSVEYLERIRDRLRDSTGREVNFCWMIRLDPQIEIAYGDAAWALHQYQETLERLLNLGDEIGLHVHTYRWSKANEGWIDEMQDQAWIDECLDRSVVAYREGLGRNPTSLRWGSFWLSTASVNHSETLGVKYDLTVEPGLKPTMGHSRKPGQTASTNSFCKVPREPYQPAREDFTHRAAPEEQRSITMIPLTSGYIDPGWGVSGVKRRLGRLYRNGWQFRKQHMPLSMWKQWDDRNTYTQMLERAIALQANPYFAAAIRADLDGRQQQAYQQNLEALIAHPLTRRFQFGGPASLMSTLSSSGGH